MEEEDTKQIIPRHISTGFSTSGMVVRNGLQLGCESCSNGSVTLCLAYWELSFLLGMFLDFS
jgi:hypothetical protein